MAKVPSRAPADDGYDEPGDEALDEGPPPEGATMVTAAPTMMLDEPPPELDESNKTVVFDTNKPRPAASLPPKLVVAKGQKPGTEYVLTGNAANEWMVGRGDQCQAVIPDISVSRKHVLIKKKGKDHFAIDQGSGNGTLVNGESITEHKLSTGDEIEIGDTVLQYVEAGAAAGKGGKKPQAALPGATSPRAPRPPPPSSPDATGVMPAPTRPGAPGRPGARLPPPPGRGPSAGAAAPQGGKKKPLVLALVGVVALVFVGMALKLTVLKPPPPPPPKPSGPPPEELAAKELNEGIKLVADNKWIEAQKRFERALEHQPENRDARKYFERCTIEVPNEKAFLEAKECLTKGDVRCAGAAMKTAKKDSLLYETNGKEIEAQVAVARTKKVEELNAALDAAKSIEEASAAGVSVQELASVFGEEPDIRALVDKVTTRVTDLGKPPPCIPPKCIPKKKLKPEEEAKNAVSDALDRGKIGEAIGAVKVCDHDDCKALEKKLIAFEKAYNAAMAADGEAAAKPGAAARKLGQEVGAPAKMLKPISDKVAKVFYSKGIDAKAQDNLERAFTNFEKTLEADPGHAGAKKEIAAMRDKAKEIYLSGYVEREMNPESAKRKFKIVMKITQPGDENHEKAKKWYDRLEGKGGE